MTSDPFDPAFDPYRQPAEIAVPRRVVLAVLAGAPLALTPQACVARRIACAPPTVAALWCEHRFCRYRQR